MRSKAKVLPQWPWTSRWDQNMIFSKARVVGGVLKRIAAKEFDYVHVGTPCNTFSQARFPKIRSKKHPAGKPDATVGEQRILRKANIVTNNSIKVLKKACEHGVACSVENPIGSLLWSYRAMLK